MSITLNMTGRSAAAIAARRSGLTAALIFASLAMVAGTADAQSRGGRGHGYYGGHGYHGGGHYAPRHGYYRHGGSGWIWGGVGLGLGLGLASAYASPLYYDYSEPRYVVVNPPPTVVYDAPQPVYSQPVPVRSSQPVIYPRNGQSAAQTDVDADACSQWAGQQPNATSDRSVFVRATQACMDARGYTVR